ncbi:hypothetical protein MPER_05886 [Moniliophthora perniciosa FA553]|nr:hypothetical protein MPER_05886 [Moniliophthora perniciosa FA553]
MSIEPGYYYIQNREQYVGHSDESTGPQRVIVLPEGVKAPKWKVDRVEGDRYTIQVEESDGSYAPV